MDVRDVLHINGRAVDDFENNVLNILGAFDIAATADEVFRRGDFEHTTADIGIAHLDCVDDFAKRNVVGDKRVWV